MGTTSYAQSTAEYPLSTPSSTPCRAGLCRGRSGLPVRRAAAMPHHPQPDEPRVFRVAPEFALPAWRTAAALHDGAQGPSPTAARAAGSARRHCANCRWKPRRRTRRSWGLGLAPNTHTPHTHAPDAGPGRQPGRGQPVAAVSRPAPLRKGPAASGLRFPERPRAAGLRIGARAAPGGPRHWPGRSGKPTPSSARLAPRSAAASGGPRSLCRAAPREGPGGNLGGTGRGRRD